MNRMETFKMQLISEWRRVVALSLSFWLQVAGMLVLVAPELWFRWTGQDYDPYVVWWLSAILLLAGLAGRLLRQGLSWWREWLRLGAVLLIASALALVLAGNVRADDAAQYDMATPASEAATLSIAVPLIASFEGERLVAYRDIVGVWTICYGSTRGVHARMKMSPAQCLDLLRREVAEYRARLHRYFTAATLNMRLPSPRDAAYTSLAYNCGVAAIGRSTAVRRLNAGDVRGGCEAVTWWNKAGHRVVRGLFVRRQAERDLCLIGT